MLAFCERCDHEVEGEYAHPARRRWAKFYFLLPIPFIPFIPIMASDFAVAIPGSMIYCLGLGPVLGFYREPPLCTECGAIVNLISEHSVRVAETR